MVKVDLMIARGDGAFGPIEAFKTNKDSMFAIHRMDRSEPWMVTFVPTGTKVDTLFHAGLRHKANRDILLKAIDDIEQLQLASFLIMSTFPFGTCEFPPEYEYIKEDILAYAKALQA